MIQKITDALRDAVTAFLTANYSTVADIASAPVYILPDFNPDDKDGYLKFNAATNYFFVLHNISDVMDEGAPAKYLKMRYACDLTICRKGVHVWDATNKQDTLAQGSTDPLVTSMGAVATNFAKYLSTFPKGLLEDTSVYQAYRTRVQSIGPIKYTGLFAHKTLDIESLRMETITIS